MARFARTSTELHPSATGWTKWTSKATPAATTSKRSKVCSLTTGTTNTGTFGSDEPRIRAPRRSSPWAYSHCVRTTSGNASPVASEYSPGARCLIELALEQALHPAMQLLGDVSTKRRVELEQRLRSGHDARALERVCNVGFCVHRPAVMPAERIHPQLEAAFLSHVDLLPLTEEHEHDAPIGDAAGDREEKLGLGSRTERTHVLLEYLLLVPSALGLVEDENVFGRGCVRARDVVLEEALQRLDEVSAVQRFLQHVYEWVVSRQEHAWRPRATAGWDECVEPLGVHELKADEGFAGPGCTGEHDELARTVLLRFGSELEQPRDHTRDAGCIRSLDPRQRLAVKEGASRLRDARERSVVSCEPSRRIRPVQLGVRREGQDLRPELIRWGDDDSLAFVNGPAIADRDEKRDDLATVTGRAVVLEVARVAADLILARGGRPRALLELDDDDGTVLEDGDVRAPVIPRELVLEDGGEVRGGRKGIDTTRSCGAQDRDAGVPSYELFVTALREAVREASGERRGLGSDQFGEVAGPAAGLTLRRHL